MVKPACHLTWVKARKRQLNFFRKSICHRSAIHSNSKILLHILIVWLLEIMQQKHPLILHYTTWLEKSYNNPGISYGACLLYTSDAADEEDSVDLGGRRIIKKKK